VGVASVVVLVLVAVLLFFFPFLDLCFLLSFFPSFLPSLSSFPFFLVPGSVSFPFPFVVALLFNCPLESKLLINRKVTTSRFLSNDFGMALTSLQRRAKELSSSLTSDAYKSRGIPRPGKCQSETNEQKKNCNTHGQSVRIDELELKECIYMFVVRWKSFMSSRVSMFQEMSLHILMHLNILYSIWKCQHIDECLSKRSNYFASSFRIARFTNAIRMDFLHWTQASRIVCRPSNSGMKGYLRLVPITFFRWD